MKSTASLLGITLALLTATALAQGTDKKGSKDNPLLSRIPGYYIGEQTTKDFDSYTAP